jgi:(R,R)-butanediol dehydrogenase / meso-butanediol dehydrogenase / diacetyl reductase
MRAALYLEKNKPLGVQNVADPAPVPGQVILAVKGAGVCGSDLHMVQYGFAAPGQILGHEFAGEIVALGADTTPGLKIGDRVTALPVFPCHACEACDAGLVGLCPGSKIVGTTLMTQGAYAEFTAVDSRYVQKLPDGVSFAEGAMVEPLAVGRHTVSRGDIKKGEAVLILGGGPIGAAVTLFARQAGAAHVVVSEPSAVRRARVQDLGATATIDPTTQNVAEAFAVVAGRRPHVVYECVGAPGLFAQAIDLAGLRGRVVVAGVLFEEERFSALPALAKEISVAYVQMYTARDFEAVIDVIARGEIDVKPMHTSTVSLDQLPAAFEALRSAPQQCKVIVDPAL